MDTPQKSNMPSVNGEVVIRPHEVGDANRVLALMREVFIDEMGWDRAFIVDAARVLAGMLDDHRPGRDLFLVAESGKKIVGVMFLVNIHDRMGFIRWLVVHKDFRRTGLGRDLLNRALAFSREDRFDKLRLVTVGELTTARRFYLKAGFSEVGRRPDLLWRMRHTLCFMEMDVPPT
jgi:GNAT superfamily N-acetyltransferase